MSNMLILNYGENRAPLRRLLNCIIFSSSLLLACCIAAAETHEDRVKKCASIPVAVPSFSCKDGNKVPKKIDAKGHCAKPENLYARCVHQSTLGQLEKGNKDDVEIYFSCRKEPVKGNTYKGDTSNTYYDIAVIQYDKNTGNTCFYQREGTTSGDNIPAPAADKNGPADSNGEVNGTFWNAKPDFCTSCHSNGPFVRTPHYQEVKDKANPSKLIDILPGAYRRKPGKYKYKVLHEHFDVYEVTKKGNSCLLCHSVGAYKPAGKQLTMGQINWLAAGSILSLREGLGAADCPSPLVTVNGKKKCPSPTTNGYHDFMIGMMGIDSAGAKKAIAELDACLKKPTPKDCKVTKLSP